MTDIVERLRGNPAPGDHVSKIINEAADEIERLRQATILQAASSLALTEELKKRGGENERLRAYANHERSLGAEGPMIDLMQAKQEIEQLRTELREILDDSQKVINIAANIAAHASAALEHSSGNAQIDNDRAGWAEPLSEEERIKAQKPNPLPGDEQFG